MGQNFPIKVPKMRQLISIEALTWSELIADLIKAQVCWKVSRLTWVGSSSSSCLVGTTRDGSGREQWLGWSSLLSSFTHGNHLMRLPLLTPRAGVVPPDNPTTVWSFSSHRDGSKASRLCG